MAERAGRMIKILIVDDIAETRENIRKLLQFEADFNVVGAARSGTEALEMARESKPDVVIMDINMPDMDGITATQKLLKDVPYAQIIILSVQSEPDYMRRAMMAGARDFISKPPSGDELISTIRTLAVRAHEQRADLEKREEMESQTPAFVASAPLGRLIAFFSAKGGVGCTTLATNAAIGLARGGASTVLVDANLQFGDAAVFLNLQVRNSIGDLAVHMDELEHEIVDDVLMQHESGISLLAAPPRPELADEVRSDHVRAVLHELKRRFEYVIVDTSSTMDDTSLAVLDSAELLIAVATPDIPSIKDTRLLFDLLNVLEFPHEHVMFVLNKTDRRTGITAEAVSENLKRPVDAEIPVDERVVVASINRGVPLMMGDRSKPPARDIVRLVGTIERRLSELSVEAEEA